jgi:hypothetical protein
VTTRKNKVLVRSIEKSMNIHPKKGISSVSFSNNTLQLLTFGLQIVLGLDRGLSVNPFRSL